MAACSVQRHSLHALRQKWKYVALTFSGGVPTFARVPAKLVKIVVGLVGQDVKQCGRGSVLTDPGAETRPTSPYHIRTAVETSGKVTRRRSIWSDSAVPVTSR